jgi:hypothetical protein
MHVCMRAHLECEDLTSLFSTSARGYQERKPRQDVAASGSLCLFSATVKPPGYTKCTYAIRCTPTTNRSDGQRTFVREGILRKLCRKGYKPFNFWLFSDKLLYGEVSVFRAPFSVYLRPHSERSRTKQDQQVRTCTLYVFGYAIILRLIESLI